MEGQDELQIQKNLFSLFLYIGVTIEFTWVFQIQDLVPPYHDISPEIG